MLYLKAGFEGAKEAIGISDATGIHIYQNRAFENMFEATVDEIKKKGGTAFLYSDTEFGQAVVSEIRGGGSWSGETEMLTASGRRIHAEVRAGAIKNESGEVIGLICFHTDITEKRNEENALKSRIGLESLITSVVSMFRNVELEEIKPRTEESLRLICESLKVDSAVLMTFSEDTFEIEHFYESCKDNAFSAEKFCFDFLANSPSRASDKLIKGEPVNISSVRELNEEREEIRNLIIGSGVKSLAAVPIRQDERLIGVMGFSSINNERMWTEQEIGVFRILSEIYAGVMEKKRALEDLKCSEEVFREVVERLDDGVLFANQNGEICLWNRGFENITGICSSEAVGKKIWEIDANFSFESRKTAEYTKRRFHELTEMIGETGSHSQDSIAKFDEEILFADGKKRYLRQYAFNAGKKEDPLVCVITRDETNRVAIEEALRENEERYRSIVEQLTEGLILSDYEGRVLEWNSRAAEITGVRRENAIGKMAFDLQAEISMREKPEPKELKALYENSIFQMKDPFERGERFCIDSEVKIKNKNGEIRTVEQKAFPISSKGRILACVLLSDITDRRLIEEAARESSERFRAVFEDSPVGMQLFDEEGHLSMTNKAMSEILDIPIEALGGFNLFDGNLVKKRKKELLKSKKTVRFETLVKPEDFNAYDKSKRERQLFLDVIISPVKIRGAGKGYLLQAADITQQREFRDELLARETRFRELFNNMGSCVAVVRALSDGKDFEFTDWNRAAENIEGILKKDIVGQALIEVFEGADRVGLTEALRRVFRTGRSEYFPPSFYYDSKKSDWREGYLYKLPEGDIVIVYDIITDRIEAEKALKESEEKYRLLADNISDVIVSTDLEGKLIYASPSIEMLLGFKHSNVIGKKLDDFVEDAFRDDIKRMMEYFRIEKEKSPKSIAKAKSSEVKLTKKGGGNVFGEVKSVLVESERGDARILSVIRDVTKRKGAENALKESEARLSRIMETVPSVIMIVDKEGSIRFLNSQFERATGMRRDEIIGKPVINAGWNIKRLNGDPLKTEELIFSTIRDGESAIGVERMVELKDGRVKYFYVNAAELSGFEGGSIVASLTDITEKHKKRVFTEMLNEGLLDLGSNPVTNIISITNMGTEIFAEYLFKYYRLTSSPASNDFSALKSKSIEMLNAEEDHPIRNMIRGIESIACTLEELDDMGGLEEDVIDFLPEKVCIRQVYTGAGTAGCLCLFVKNDQNIEISDRDVFEMIVRAIEVEEERLNHEEDLKSFANLVSHELRQSATLLKGYAETLRLYGREMDEKTRNSVLKEIDISAVRFDSVVTELLYLSRVDKGSLLVECEECDVQKMI